MGFRRSCSRCALALAAAALLAPGAALAFDADADGVGDDADNCLELANSTQRDTDADGFGNGCDADFDQDGIVGLADYNAVQGAFGAQVGDPAYDPTLDLDDDGAVGGHEFSQVAALLDSPPGPSGLACAGEAECLAGGVQIDLAEPVLSRAARVAWRAASPSTVFEVERRSSGGAWERAALVGGSERAFVDGAAGGLAPGTYEYRVRGDGPWSEPGQVEIRDECAGQPPTSPLLPVVEIVDHEPDGDHDGEDVAAALAECSRRRGCVLRALPVVYEDVNAELALHTGYEFSNGLAIEGYGSATVFRSRVFSAADHDSSHCPPGTPPPCYRPRPVFSIAEPGAGPTRLDGVRFRNFRIEGRKREQPDPGALWNSWQHYGILLATSTPVPTSGGCVHNVTASDLMTGGFGVMNTVGWIFENNTIRDIGCQDDLTPCEGLQRTPEYISIPGVRSVGMGIVAGTLTFGTVVRGNRVSRTTKYGIAADNASGFHIHDNVVEEVGGTGIECGNCDNGVIERNEVRWMRYPTGRNAAWPEGYGGDVAHGIQCVGSGHHLSILDNLVFGGAGSGIRLQCAGPGLLVQGNAIVGNCREYGSSLVVGRGRGALLLENTVRDHPGGCDASVLVNRAHDARIEGGSIQGGPGTRVGVFAVGTAEDPTTGLVLRNLRITGWGTGTAIYLAPTSSGTTLYDSTCTSGFPTPLYDGSPGATTRRAADPAGACSP